MRAFLLSLAAGVAALPAFSSAETCGPAITDAYHRGFTEGVAAVNAQLGAVTAQMQRDVQAQVNAQLAQLDARRTAELEARLAEAQDRALSSETPQIRVNAAPAAALTMPTLPPLTVAPGGAIVPILPARPDPNRTVSPDTLPPGTTITITDPQNLPPDLFDALMRYATR